jgi:acetyltransferase-like isoleucine patch superfamily enzyme
MDILFACKKYITSQETPFSRLLYKSIKTARGFSFPLIPVVHKVLYGLHFFVKNAFANMLRVFYFTPLLQSRLIKPAKGLYLYSGLPLILGNLSIEIGENTRVSGQTTFTGRASSQAPRLSIGANCDIGWQTTIAVGTKVIIGDNVRIAGRAFLAGYPGHPLDNARRARGEACDPHQSGDIILGNGVWLATGVTISAGVTIGEGTIIAAGSVVTKDLPAFVMAAGVPAKIIKAL